MGKYTIGGAAEQWGIRAMGLDLLVEASQEGRLPQEEVICAVLDTGFDTSRPTLKGRVSSASRSFMGDDTLRGAKDHGTEVASIIAEATPPNVTLLLLKVGDEVGGILKYAGDDAFCEAIVYARRCGASVINMSIDIYTTPRIPVAQWDSLPAFDIEIKRCEEAGIPFVVGSGNDGDVGGFDASCHYPAASEHVIAASGLCRNLSLWKGSSTGSCVDFAAAGEDVPIVTWVNDTKYCFFSSGTSLAAPHISAAAMYVKMLDPRASVSFVREALASCSRHFGEPGKDRCFGWGMPVMSEYVLGMQPRVRGSLGEPVVIDATKGCFDQDASNLFDGGIRTKWCVNAPEGAFVEWDEPVPIAPSHINFVSADDNSRYVGRNPGNAKLLSRSDPDDAWCPIWELPQEVVLPDEDYRLYSFEIDGPLEPARYYRLEISPADMKAGGVMQLSRLELLPC